jgi:hypothetical protein
MADPDGDPGSGELRQHVLVVAAEEGEIPGDDEKPAAFGSLSAHRR